MNCKFGMKVYTGLGSLGFMVYGGLGFRSVGVTVIKVYNGFRSLGFLGV